MSSNPSPPPPSNSDRWRILIAGFVGGILSPMIRPLQEFLAQRRYPADIGTEYWLLAIFLGLTGVALVVILKETEAPKALTLGLSLPAFLINLGGAVQNTGDKPQLPPPAISAPAESSGGVGAIPFFSYAAYAQDVVPTAAVPKRTIEIAAVDQQFAYRADILDSNSQTIESFSTLEKNSSLVVRPLPTEATGIRFTIGASQSVVYPLGGQPGWTIGIALRATITRKLGFAQVLGKTPDLEARIFADVEARAKADAGLQGWIFLGTRSGNNWGMQTVDSGDALPKSGDSVKVIIPVNVRDEARSKKPRVGIISAGQKVKLLGDPEGSSSLWAKIEVLPDDL